MAEQQNKFEFFYKLGYSKEEVWRVLEKLGHEASDNDLLQELIQIEGRPQENENGTQCVHPSSLGAQPLPQSSVTETSELFSNLRPIIIDGSNVAMSHGNKEVFSCLGIQLVVDWFKQRGHQYIKVFVPSWRKEPTRFDTPIKDHHLLENLAKQAILVYTPSRKIKGKRMTCYDDRYIVKLAYEQDGVIVSNDNFRDLQNENPEWKWFIEQRLLMYSFVNDKFMPPDDPLGRYGPSLDNFLSKKPFSPESKWQHCPYGKKCTYGIKCKFYHPGRVIWDHLSVADELRAKAKTFSFSQRTEEEKMRTNKKSGQTSALCDARSTFANRSSIAVGSKIFHPNNTPQEFGSANNNQGNQQAPFTLLEDQTIYAAAASMPVTAPPWTARIYSGNTLTGPEDSQDLMDGRHDLRYRQSPPVSRHSLCLNCPCLEVCNFQGCYRKWIPAMQTLQTPSFLARQIPTAQPREQDSTMSSIELFSYGKPGVAQDLGNQPFLLDSGLLRAEDGYVLSSCTGSWPTLVPSPLLEEQAHLQQPRCFGFPHSQEGQASASASSDPIRNAIASAPRHGSLHRRLPNRKPW